MAKLVEGIQMFELLRNLFGDKKREERIKELEKEMEETKKKNTSPSGSDSPLAQARKDIGRERIQLADAVASAKTETQTKAAQRAYDAFEREVEDRIQEAKDAETAITMKVGAKEKELAEAKKKAADAEKIRRGFWFFLGWVAVNALTPLVWWETGIPLLVVLYIFNFRPELRKKIERKAGMTTEEEVK